MKDTRPDGRLFNAYFAQGAIARTADSQCAAHGAEMDAPEIMPAGAAINHGLVYPWPWPQLISR